MVRELLIDLSFAGIHDNGLNVHARNLVPRLMDLDPVLLSANGSIRGRKYPVPANISQEYGTKGNLRRLWWKQTELPRRYRELNASLLFSPIPEAPIARGCRSVVTVHDLIPLRFPKFSPLTLYNRYYLPVVLRRAEHIIAVSGATAGDVMSFFGIGADRITVIRSGFDRSCFRPLNLPVRPYFLYLGRHDPHKNLVRLLEAFAGLPDEYELFLVGSFDRRFTPLLQQRAEELQISGRVKFTNYVPYDKLPILLNQALALVYPSLWEGFGLPVLEAMACGTPTVASNLASIPEVTGDAAILVDPYRVEAIRDAMRQVAESAELRTKLRDAGSRRADLFSWEKAGRETREVLARFL
jgi:glycosyltransferase involved in cell wall biosynthesis